MTRYPRKFKRQKRVQLVERPACPSLHPARSPEFFDRRKLQAQNRLTEQLTAKGWTKIRYDYKPSGILVVYGERLRDPAVLVGARAGLYELFLIPPRF